MKSCITPKRLPALLPLFFVLTAGAQPWIDTAASYIGTKEATGRNDGKRVERFLAYSGLPPGHPWCAAFAGYCLHAGGIKNAPKSPWCPAWFAKSAPGDEINPLESTKGDAFGIYYQKLNRIAHIGLIEAREGNVLVTIEGNTNAGGSRSGDGVYRRRRPVRTIHAARRYRN